MRLLPGAPSEKMDAEVWRRTRILIAPSLWPEPFGLVAIEASLRGIPAISTDVAGLREANVNAEFVVPTPLVHDVEIDATYRSRVCVKSGHVSSSSGPRHSGFFTRHST